MPSNEDFDLVALIVHQNKEKYLQIYLREKQSKLKLPHNM